MSLGQRTIASALHAAAATACGLTFIEHDASSRRATYAAIQQDALAIAGALRDRGYRTGERVALVVPDVDGFVHAFFGIVSAGLVPVPLCPPGQAGDLTTFAIQSRHILTASRAVALVTTADVAPLLHGIAGETAASADPTTVPPTLLVNDLLQGPTLAAAIDVPLDAVALLQYTSGSTALPKGVVLTQANIAANVAAILGPSGLDARPGDVAVSWLPLYHDMGLIGMLLSSVYAGADAVLMSPVLFLKRPSAWLDAISRYRGTVSFAPSFAYDLCQRRVKASQVAALDLSCWRVAGCGAEPIRPDTLRQFAEYFEPAGFRAESFLPSYGLAEHALAVSFAHGGVQVDLVDAEQLVRHSRAVPAEGDAPSVRVVCCGRSFPDHAFRIVDDAGHEVPDRHVGLIVARGPSVMREYADNPEETADALRDGWLVTGDLGYTVDGALYVCGRKKDLIIRHGRKYHPPDLESSLVGMQGIALSGAVVFAVNHLEGSDEIVAVVETRGSARGAELEDAVRRRIRETAGLELDRIVLAPPGTIPRTTSGKVRRSETRARLEAGTLTR
ncbi:MAG: fatty acyl-AMP ligase [Vicinamibacterales bacterium]